MRPRMRWFLVLNSTVARIVRGLPPPDAPGASEIVITGEARRLRDFISDRAGRSQSSARGGRRSAMEPGTDPISEDERDFVRQVMSLLDAHRRAGDFDELVVVASPRMLGRMRPLMPASLKAVMVREIAANLSRTPESELPARLRAQMDGNAA